jgi:hypothetical protein
MAEITIQLVAYLAVFIPLYLVLLRSLGHLSRQKSEAASRVPGGASQS